MKLDIFFDKHFEAFAAKEKVQRPKAIKDMNPDEFRTTVLRRQFVSRMMDKIRDAEFEEHQIYQVLLEELRLIGAKLPSDKMNHAIKEAQRTVGPEVAALQKKLKDI